MGVKQTCMDNTKTEHMKAWKYRWKHFAGVENNSGRALTKKEKKKIQNE